MSLISNQPDFGYVLKDGVLYRITTLYPAAALLQNVLEPFAPVVEVPLDYSSTPASNSAVASKFGGTVPSASQVETILNGR